jgi:uncharacterized protein YbbC (DUF1343 family)
VDAGLRPAAEILSAAGAQLHALFGPEHGHFGAAQDMVGVRSAAGRAAVPVHSLYGDTPEALSPRYEWLDGLDAVVIDLQDVGSRYYTYVWTATLMLRACAARGVQTIVIDRPNPLGGLVVEGAPQRPGYRSFVGLYDVAVRHGMTIGEICTMVRRLERLPEDNLTILAMEGWRRSMLFPETGLPWVLPSPNMPTFDTAMVYPGGCLLEGTNLSEGRGSTRPFEIWGAPFLDGERLAASMSVEGAILRPLVFRPTFHKHAGVDCGGVQVHVTDASRFRAYATYARLIAAVRRQAREDFAWRTERYEFVSDRPAIDLLAGGSELRAAVEAPDAIDGWLVADSRAATDFLAQRADDLLYRHE